LSVRVKLVDTINITPRYVTFRQADLQRHLANSSIPCSKSVVVKGWEGRKFKIKDIEIKRRISTTSKTVGQDSEKPPVIVVDAAVTEIRDEYDLTPLMHASAYNYPEAAALLIRELIRLELSRQGISQDAANSLSAAVALTFLLVLLWPVLAGSPAAWSRLFARTPPFERILLYAAIAGLLLRGADWALLMYLAGAPLLVSPRTACSAGGSLVASIVVMAVMTPLVEEIVHRGLIYRSLEARGKPIAVLLSAGWFALLHTGGTRFTAFVFGVAAAILLWRSRTLWAPIAAHATFNLAAVTEAACSVRFVSASATGTTPCWLVIAVLSVAGALWAAFGAGTQIVPAPSSFRGEKRRPSAQ